MKCIVYRSAAGEQQVPIVALATGNDGVMDAVVAVLNGIAVAKVWIEETPDEAWSVAGIRFAAVRCDSTVDPGDEIVDSGLYVEAP